MPSAPPRTCRVNSTEPSPKGAAAPSATDGLFVPMTSPTRIVDTRVAALNPLGGTTNPQPGWRFEVPVATNAAVARTATV